MTLSFPVGLVHNLNSNIMNRAFSKFNVLKNNIDSKQHVTKRNNRYEHMTSLLLLASVVISSLTFGQSEIKGIITDEFGLLSNVNISIKNTRLGTSTDENDQYNIQAKPSDTLRVSHVGYEPVDIVVGHFKEININLKNYQVLDEVVVNAFDSGTISCGIICETIKTNCYVELIENKFKGQEDIETVKLYPNPSKDGVFNISLLEDISQVNIIIADLTGRIILNRTERKLSSKVIIDLSNQSSVIYVINILSKGVQITSKKAIKI
ncbi:carboxypeptidase-like regulatory domain-containing protein [Psychroserpens sp. Hel_I_66]|uniref:carboxypeptidase-like regulatory domain-containing protein n=1 Tax=Psychroserpens sp. Hel_I_66 TaxID=1250004 RepID=UPI000645F234|nr:carboxypeptidase-like regulatory domain-containing protein [Psychroserpens sp. Hel_I_66]